MHAGSDAFGPKLLVSANTLFGLPGPCVWSSGRIRVYRIWSVACGAVPGENSRFLRPVVAVEFCDRQSGNVEISFRNRQHTLKHFFADSGTVWNRQLGLIVLFYRQGWQMSDVVSFGVKFELSNFARSAANENL